MCPEKHIGVLTVYEHRITSMFIRRIPGLGQSQDSSPESADVSASRQEFSGTKLGKMSLGKVKQQLWKARPGQLCCGQDRSGDCSLVMF